MECYERIARFHIVSLHQCALDQLPYPEYSAQQDKEQLDKTLLTLLQFYDDNRTRYRSPNEAEFRAYCIIFEIRSPGPNIESKLSGWPQGVIKDQRIKNALKLYACASNAVDPKGPLRPASVHWSARENWEAFWKTVDSYEISYLMACAAEINFEAVRRGVLSSLWTAFRQSNKINDDWTLEELVGVLGFDEEEQVKSYCESFGFRFGQRAADGKAFLDLNSVASARKLPEPAVRPSQIMNHSIVEAKRQGRTIPSVITGMSVREARRAGQIEEYDEMEQDQVDGQPQKEDSLFVTGHSDDEEEDQGKEKN
ncbi:hypothetical protein LTS18_002018, partial [Coniosporium uncinatum]